MYRRRYLRACRQLQTLNSRSILALTRAMYIISDNYLNGSDPASARDPSLSSPLRTILIQSYLSNSCTVTLLYGIYESQGSTLTTSLLNCGEGGWEGIRLISKPRPKGIIGNRLNEDMARRIKELQGSADETRKQFEAQDRAGLESTWYQAWRAMPEGL